MAGHCRAAPMTDDNLPLGGYPPHPPTRKPLITMALGGCGRMGGFPPMRPMCVRAGAARTCEIIAQYPPKLPNPPKRSTHPSDINHLACGRICGPAGGWPELREDGPRITLFRHRRGPPPPPIVCERAAPREFGSLSDFRKPKVEGRLKTKAAAWHRPWVLPDQTEPDGRAAPEVWAVDHFATGTRNTRAARVRTRSNGGTSDDPHP